MAYNEKAKATIYLDGKQAEAALESLKKKARELRQAMKEAQSAGDQVKYKKLERELKGVESATRSLRKESFDYEKVLRNINGASMNDLRKALRTVETQLRKMSRTDPGYATKAAQAKLLRSEISKVNTVVRGQPSLLQKAANGFNKYFAIVSAGIATLTGIAFSVKELIQGTVGLDDSLADVMKTTGLARSEVREMYTDFRSFNTRTPRRELLLLAEEAGRLGKNTRKDVMDFVEVANQIKVALGDDLGGEASVAIREVGKLTDIYKVGEEYGTGFKDSMLKIGSAINEVSANSNAQAPYLIDYLKRMGGVAGQAKVNASQIIGYASALDQLGQKQEMAATAHGKVLVDMFKDSAKYANIAEMSLANFTDLLNTDANEAFLKVLEGLNGNNEGFSVMAEKLDELGVDGARAVQVLSVLSANTKIVREQQVLANEAMNEGISLTNEYNVKNNNLAGSWDKIGQYIRSKFINSGFLGWLEKVVGKVAQWTEVKLEDSLREEQAELNSLVTAIVAANDNQRVRNSLISELQSKYPDFLGNLDAEKVTTEELKNLLIEANAQYRERIRLAALNEKSAEVQREGIELASREQEIVETVNKLYQQFQYEGLNYAETFQEQVDAFAEADKTHGFIAAGVLSTVKNLGNEYDTIQQKIQDNTAEYQKWLDLANKVQQRLDPNSGAPGSGSGNEGVGTSGDASGGGTAYDYEAETDAPLGLESWMLSGEWDQFGAERLAQKKADEEEWTEFLNEQIQKRMDAVARELEVEQEIEASRQELKELRINSVGQIAGAIAGMFQRGSAAYIAFFALEKAMAVAQVWTNYAKESAALHASAAAMGPLGIAWDAAMQAKALTQAKINTGIIAAQAIVGAVGSTSKRKKDDEYWMGGPTGPGGKYEPAGIVHKKEYVIPSEGTENPTLKPVIDFIEIARRQGTLAQIDFSALAQVPSRQMYAGGYSSGTAATTANVPQSSTDTELKQLLREATAAMNEMREAKEQPPVLAFDTFEREHGKYAKMKQSSGF